MARATGRLQRTGVSSRSTSVIPGPNDATVSSMPYGPPLTLKKKMAAIGTSPSSRRSEEHTSELQSRSELVCRLLLEKKKQQHQLQSLYQGEFSSTTSRTL